MVDIRDYISEENIENKTVYDDIKDEITCLICKDIIINPVFCMNCHKNFCSNCIERWNNEHDECPFRCKNPKYNNSINLLSKLKFNCKDCGSVVDYDNMERHVRSKCETIDINFNVNLINPRKGGIIKKISNRQMDKYIKKIPKLIKSMKYNNI